MKDFLIVLRQLLQRYQYQFLLAWQQYKKHPKINTNHVDFLPDVIALQEKPLSPLPHLITWLILSVIIAALLWSIIGKMDVVASAEGKIIPAIYTKTIQSGETATIHKISVTNGQKVKTGQILIELDTAISQAELEQIQLQRMAEKLTMLRANLFLNKLKNSDSQLLLSHLDNLSPEKIELAQQVLFKDYFDYQQKQAKLLATIELQQASIQTQKQTIKKIQMSLPILAKQNADYQSLLRENIVGEHEYLAIHQHYIELQQDLLVQSQRLTELNAQLNMARQELKAHQTEAAKNQMDKLDQSQQSYDKLTQELIKAQKKQALKYLTTPVNGTVEQLAVHTAGGVVTPGQALMNIVPDQSSLIVEAYIKNKDVGFVLPGETVRVKVETFNFTKYGIVTGHIIHISHDAINDEKRGLVYTGRIELQQNYILINGKKYFLKPGMAVTAEIKTSQRRIIEYFLTPVLTHVTGSLHER